MTTVVLGSLAPLAGLDLAAAGVGDARDAVVVGTAAVYTGIDHAIDQLAAPLAELGFVLEVLAVADRRASADEALAARIARCDLAVLAPGSALHARQVWRDSAVGRALAEVPLLAIGEVATVLGETMVDPRGGAPTIGLGWRRGAVITRPAGEDQLRRTRRLLGPRDTLIVLGDDGVVAEDGGRWRVVAGSVALLGDEDPPTPTTR